MHGCRIHVVLDDTSLTPNVKHSLDRLGAETIVTSFPVDAAETAPPVCDARLVLTEHPESLMGGRLPKLLSWCNRSTCATLIVSQTGSVDPTTLPPDFGDRAVGFASALSREELTGRLSAMCSFRPTLDRVHGELDATRRVNTMQRQQIERLDKELRAASVLQRSLCWSLPVVRGARVRTIFKPADTLSGDICDVARVDDSQVCITLADVTGHGLTSAILAAHVRRSLQGDRHATDPNGRLCPSRILQRANRDLLDTPPQDCQFVTAVVAVFDEDTQLLRWARAGAPHPMLLRSHRAPVEAAYRVELLKSEGPLLGVISEAKFETAAVRLNPGDTVVFHTDGLEEYLPESPAAFCNRVLATPWKRQARRSDCSSTLDALIEAIEFRLTPHELNKSAERPIAVSGVPPNTEGLPTNTVGAPTGGVGSRPDRIGQRCQSPHEDDVSVVALRVMDR